MAETLGDKLSNIEAKVVVDASAGTLLEVEPETLKNTLADLMTEALINALLRQLGTLGDVEAEALIDTLSDTLSEVVAETIGNTMADVKAEALLDALAETRYQGSKLKHCTRHWSKRCMTR